MALGPDGAIPRSWTGRRRTMSRRSPPRPRWIRRPSRAADAANNLKQVGLAMENYREAHGRFPAPAIQGPDGKPLLSWRVAILPYLDERRAVSILQARRALGQPPQQAIAREDAATSSLRPVRWDQAPGSLTHLRVFVGEGTPFEGGRGPRWEDFSDGSGSDDPGRRGGRSGPMDQAGRAALRPGQAAPRARRGPTTGASWS